MVTLAGDGGFPAVTWERLASEAGVEVQEAARHADSLDALLADAYADATDRLFDVYVGAFSEDGTWADRFERGAASILEAYARSPGLARVCEREVLRAGPLSRTARDAANDRWVRYVAGAIGREAGVPALHFELIRGALTQAVLDGLEDGLADVGALQRRLAEVVAMFEPVAA
jgi:hypothetical protein